MSTFWFVNALNAGGSPLAYISDGLLFITVQLLRSPTQIRGPGLKAPVHVRRSVQHILTPRHTNDAGHIKFYTGPQ